jgi:hypothetical protein
VEHDEAALKLVQLEAYVLQLKERLQAAQVERDAPGEQAHTFVVGLSESTVCALSLTLARAFTLALALEVTLNASAALL